MTRTRSEIGRASRARGHNTERDVARYLRLSGWPAAERKSDTGWTAGDRASADAGDIRGLDRLACQVKSAPTLTDTEIDAALRDAANQAVVAGADLGFVVHRRQGKSNPGRWWAYLTLGDLLALLGGAYTETEIPWPADGPMWTVPVWTVPVRLALADLVPVLHRAGYGQAAA